MIKILIISFLSTFLLAQNPKIFSSLGDVIYENSVHIEKLSNIEAYSQYKEKINTYVSDVKRVKEYGIEVENGENETQIKNYLHQLRELSKTNDYFIRSVKSTFLSSIEKENSVLFTQIINSKLLDIEKNKSAIMGYYELHSSDINCSGVIEEILDTQAVSSKNKLRTKRVKRVKEDKIKRVRENDRIKQEALEKSLDEEVARKKSLIHQGRLNELSN